MASSILDACFRAATFQYHHKKRSLVISWICPETGKSLRLAMKRMEKVMRNNGILGIQVASVFGQPPSQ